MFERFTPSARQAVKAAVELAHQHGHQMAGPEHLLVSLFRVDGVAARVLASFGVDEESLERAAAGGPARQAGLSGDEVAALRAVGIDADDIVRRVHDAIGPHTSVPAGGPRWRSPVARSTKQVLEQSLREAVRLSHKCLGTEHILLAMLAPQPPLAATAVLAGRGVTYAEVRRRVLDELRRAS